MLSAGLVFLGILAVAGEPGQSPQRVVDEGAISHLFPGEQALIREYASSWPDVFAFYSSLTFDGSIRVESRTDASTDLAIVSEISGSAGIADNRKFRVEGIGPDGRRGMVIVNTDDVYAFEWNQRTQKHFLVGRAKTDLAVFDQYLSTYLFHIEPFSNGEFQRLVFGMDQAPNNKSVVLSALETCHEEGEEIVKATILCQGEGWCRILVYSFLRNRFWAKREVIEAVPDLQKRMYSISTTRCAYDGVFNGIPVLKNCVRERATAAFSGTHVDWCRVYSPGEVTVYHREQAIVDQLTPGPPDASVFDPQPYIDTLGGLGKPNRVNHQGTALIVLANIALLLVFGLFLLRRHTRSQKRA